MKNFNSFVNENIKKVDSWWFPELNTYMRPQEIKFHAVNSFNKKQKINFILKCIPQLYSIEKLNQIDNTELDNIINNEISLHLITLKYQKVV